MGTFNNTNNLYSLGPGFGLKNNNIVSMFLHKKIDF